MGFLGESLVSRLLGRPPAANTVRCGPQWCWMPSSSAKRSVVSPPRLNSSSFSPPPRPLSD